MNWSELILIMSDPSREESPPSEADVEAKWFTRPPPLMFAKGLLFRLFRRICRVDIFAHHNHSIPAMSMGYPSSLSLDLSVSKLMKWR